MIKVNNIETFGWSGALRGMRNPMNSWDKSDSLLKCDYLLQFCYTKNEGYINYGFSYHDDRSHVMVGSRDFSLMKKLVHAGTSDCKFMRMIHVQMDILAPLYWWKEFDTYKVGTVANSCSTMHKITAKEFTLDDFSTDHLTDISKTALSYIIDELNIKRSLYNINYNQLDKDEFEKNKKDYWWQIIQLLPSSYNQLRTVDLNYQVLRNIYHNRKEHKLDEWREFCKTIEALPYSELITME